MSWIPKILRRSEHASGYGEVIRHESVLLTPKAGATVIDNPIRRSEDDTLGRAGAARSFAQHVLTLDAREGIVVGVLGAWGSGKTSFINLARNEFAQADVPILDFNPWMFSGTEQLVEIFFSELAAQLRVQPRFEEIAQNIEEYGEAFSGLIWLPVLGPWIERGRQASKLLSKILRTRKEGLGGRRARLERALANLDNAIVVVLDDIDRLSSSEIKDVFKLVRLTASFPNVIYVVAFDRPRVETALSEQGVPGRDYLEKILQLAVDLPSVPSQVISRQILIAIDGALSGIDSPGTFDGDVWPNLFMEIVRPLVRNMRDVRRYAAALRGTVTALHGEIALADILALDAIRTFLPDVYGKLNRAVEGLTTISSPSYGGRSDITNLKSSIDSLIKASSTHEEVARSMIRRLFPAAERYIGGSHYGPDFKRTWLRERRVAHEEILSLYLERVAGERLKAFTDAERAFGLMADRAGFDSYLRSLDLERMEDVIAHKERITAAIGETIRKLVLPAYAAFARFVRSEYAPHGRSEFGIWSLPDGAARYRQAIHEMTTTDMDPSDLHALGLRQVTEIEAQMLAVAQKVRYPDLKSFNSHISKDRQLYGKSGEQILLLYKHYMRSVFGS